MDHSPTHEIFATTEQTPFNNLTRCINRSVAFVKDLSNRRGRGLGTSVAPFGGSADALACYLARCWYSPRDDDSSTVSSQSLLVRYPFVSGAA